MDRLLEMLKYKRPEGSKTQQEFCKKYLEPLMGSPDKYGNYVKIIGDKPDVSFMSHHDTVHYDSGYQEVFIQDGIIRSDSNCLGADCTTGVWIMLNMMEANIEGVYVIHAAEEKGLIGSTLLVKENPSWISHVDIAISFDRKGDNSIITHQMSTRTASDEFAHSLADTLGMYQLQPDPTGSYTDSEAYKGVISECCNISVGYYDQHTRNEYQDIDYLYTLMDRIYKADWSNLVVSRDVQDLNRNSSFRDTSMEEDLSSAKFLMDTYPDFVASVLATSFDMNDLFEELELQEDQTMHYNF